MSQSGVIKMAKDDYFVLVYQILAYMYRCLKAGEDIDTKMIEPDSPILKVNAKYWLYIVENMQEQGFIRGIVLTRAFGYGVVSWNLSRAEITPKGIEYLCENSTIKKAYRFLKDTKSILPFDLIP